MASTKEHGMRLHQSSKPARTPPEGALMSDNIAPEIKPTLMGIPDEDRERIWKYAVAEEDDITPYPIAPRSNKFYWNVAQFNAENSSVARTLTAVVLGRVSKQVYDEVSLGHIFYRVNHFDFTKYDLSTNKYDIYDNEGFYENKDKVYFKQYILGITPNRRHEIKSISYTYDWSLQSLSLLASCKGLQSMTLVVKTRGFCYKQKASEEEFVRRGKRARKLLIAAVQGVKYLNHIILSEHLPGSVQYSKSEAKYKTFEVNAADSLAETRTGDHDRKLYDLARQSVSLDIDGEGRISGDKRPGLVSNHTRSRTAAYETISADGVLPLRKTPKYDMDGYLTCRISGVWGSRVTSTDEGAAGVELRVSFEDGSTNSWEVSSAIKLCDHMLIVNFYVYNPHAPGFEAIYYEWVAEKNTEGIGKAAMNRWVEDRAEMKRVWGFLKLPK